MKKFFHYTLLIALCSLLFAGCGELAYKHLTHDEAKKMMANNPDAIVLDVRTPEEYEKKHIPSALLVPIEDLRNGNFSKLPDKNQTILIYCWTGRRAENVAQILVDNDYKNVYEFGGLIDWTGSLSSKDLK